MRSIVRVDRVLRLAFWWVASIGAIQIWLRPKRRGRRWRIVVVDWATTRAAASPRRLVIGGEPSRYDGSENRSRHRIRGVEVVRGRGAVRLFRSHQGKSGYPAVWAFSRGQRGCGSCRGFVARGRAAPLRGAGMRPLPHRCGCGRIVASVHVAVEVLLRGRLQGVRTKTAGTVQERPNPSPPIVLGDRRTSNRCRRSEATAGGWRFQGVFLRFALCSVSVRVCWYPNGSRVLKRCLVARRYG